MLDAAVWTVALALVALISFHVGRSVAGSADTAPLEDGRGPGAPTIYRHIRQIRGTDLPYDWKADETPPHIGKS